MRRRLRAVTTESLLSPGRGFSREVDVKDPAAILRSVTDGFGERLPIHSTLREPFDALDDDLVSILLADNSFVFQVSFASNKHSSHICISTILGD